MVAIHCMRCKHNTDTTNTVQTKTSNGVNCIKGRCKKCKTKKCKFIGGSTRMPGGAIKLKLKKGDGFFDDLIGGIKKPFQVLNNLGKPFRGVAAKVFDKLPGNPFKALGGSEKFMGMANDALLGGLVSGDGGSQRWLKKHPGGSNFFPTANPFKINDGYYNAGQQGSGIFDIFKGLFGGKVRNKAQLLRALKKYKAQGGKLGKREGKGIFDILGSLFG